MGYYEELHDVTMFCYKGKDADGKETMERFVTYGAVVFRKDTKKEDSDANPDDNDVKPNNEETDTDNVELYDKSAHTWTAINRLMNYGVSVKLYFKNTFVKLP